MSKLTLFSQNPLPQPFVADPFTVKSSTLQSDFFYAPILLSSTSCSIAAEFARLTFRCSLRWTRSDPHIRSDDWCSARQRKCADESRRRELMVPHEGRNRRRIGNNHFYPFTGVASYSKLFG